jgi:DNA-binding Xre family transcriptional regulator
MPLGTEHPVYDLWAVRRNRETGVVEEIGLSREALATIELSVLTTR